MLNQLKKIRENKGLSVIKLAELSGLTRDNIYKIENSQVNFTKNNIEALTKALNITPAELMGLSEHRMIPIKYYDISAAAGQGCFVDNENFEVISIDELQLIKMGIISNYSNIAIINARGDSMLPTIKDNDLLFVDTSQKQIFNDTIYIISERNLLKVKRILMKSPTDKTITIKSDNQISGEYPPYEIAIDGSKNIVCGQVVFFCRKLAIL